MKNEIDVDGQVEYGANENANGKWVPYIRVGCTINGKEVEFICNVSFDSLETAGEFAMATHQVLSCDQARKADYDKRGML